MVVGGAVAFLFLFSVSSSSAVLPAAVSMESMSSKKESRDIVGGAGGFLC